MIAELSPVSELAQRVATTPAQRRAHGVNAALNTADSACRFQRRLLGHHHDHALFADAVLSEIRRAEVALAQIGVTR